MQIVYLRGTALWPNLTDPDKFDNFGTNLILDDESLAIFRNLKVKAKPKIDTKSNRQYVRLNRKRYRTDKNGVRTENTPVKIVDTSCSTPGNRLSLTPSICSSFSVLMTADIA